MWSDPRYEIWYGDELIDIVYSRQEVNVYIEAGFTVLDFTQ